MSLATLYRVVSSESTRLREKDGPKTSVPRKVDNDLGRESITLKKEKESKTGVPSKTE